MDAEDSVISTTLRLLAKTDYVLARQFPLPERFKVTSEHGTISGMWRVEEFAYIKLAVAEEAIKVLDQDIPKVHGIGVGLAGEISKRQIPIKFPAEPYMITTFIIEDREGNLTVIDSTRPPGLGW